MKTILILGCIAAIATTSLLFATPTIGVGGDAAAAAPVPASTFKGFTFGDSRYAVEAQFSMTKNSSGAEQMQLDVVTTTDHYAPVFIQERKPATAKVYVDGLVVLTATAANGKLQGVIPATQYAPWLGSTHEYRLEVFDASNMLVLQGSMGSAVIKP